MPTPAQRQAKQPVSSLLAGPYGHPWHPILVTVPIGAWVASLVFDVASHLTDDPGFLTRGSLWLIALGVIGALAAAAVGFLDLCVVPPGTRAFRVGLLHMALNLAVTGAYAANFLWRRAAQPPDRAVGAAMLALSVASIAALAVSGYLGGMLAYRYGVRVADEDTQADGYRREEKAPEPS
ncbi:hypothetical protein GCM10010218_27030 [Streptomyces mashuensis]|uniref:DUF2231 domain-containing protein n=1 Tax=Streptomyces mashuensis TaxID=33904 RepID=A0A919B3D3_9ACTN|nr:DUF2231 domain-containing protein [Streptomyces mashuensis]GHF44302.1 hypothetical protein GCM10010218_27030 [Streptomyces mashuensis]